MTNKYKVTQVKDFAVVVDTNRMMAKHGEYSLTNLGGVRKVDDSPVLWENGCYPIIATISKRLDGVPLIELTDDVEQLWGAFIKSDINNGSASSYHVWLKLNNGYKAKTNKYSEEDMHKAYYRNETRFKGEPFEVFIESLQNSKYPEHVELEMEEITDNVINFKGHPTKQHYQVKITDKENNIIYL